MDLLDQESGIEFPSITMHRCSPSASLQQVSAPSANRMFTMDMPVAIHHALKIGLQEQLLFRILVLKPLLPVLAVQTVKIQEALNQLLNIQTVTSLIAHYLKGQFLLYCPSQGSGDNLGMDEVGDADW